MIIGQPVETAAMSFDGETPIECVSDTLVRLSPMGSRSKLAVEAPSAFIAASIWCSQETETCLGGSMLSTLPVSQALPSAETML